LKISDVTSIAAGHPFRGKILEKSGSGIRVIQMKDISIGEGVFWSGVIETEMVGKKSPDWLVDGDILFAARGAKNYAVLMDDIVGKVVSAPQFYILRVTESALLPEFLVWQLNQKSVQKYFESTSEGSLTKSVRRSVLENTEICIPPLQKQKQVLGLYETLKAEKAVCAELTRNVDRLMNAIANNVLSDRT
jgi:restriction endonuclease S subunit